MELIKTFGIEPILLLAQIVNFLIIMWVLRRFLYKPVLKTLKDRKDTIQEGLNSAEANIALLEKTKQEERKILKKANDTASDLLGEAKAKAEQIAKDNREKVHSETERMILEAREQITREAKEMEAVLAKNVSKVAITLLEKSLSGMLSDKGQDELMAKAMKAMQKKVN